MSGGSINYLCYAEWPEIIGRTEGMETVESILKDMGYKDVALDVRRLIEYCLSAENRVGVLFEQLKDVFHAAEWWKSGDYGDECFRKAVEEYRLGTKETKDNEKKDDSVPTVREIREQIVVWQEDWNRIQKMLERCEDNRTREMMRRLLGETLKILEAKIVSNYEFVHPCPYCGRGIALDRRD